MSTIKYCKDCEQETTDYYPLERGLVRCAACHEQMYKFRERESYAAYWGSSRRAGRTPGTGRKEVGAPKA